MITVVHVITQLELGGAQENTLYNCQFIDRNRFRTALIYGPGGLLDADAEKIRDMERVPLAALSRPIAFNKDSLAFTQISQELAQLYRQHIARGYARDAFIVHTHSSKAGILGRLAAKSLRIPHIVHTIHGFSFHPRQKRLKQLAFIHIEKAAGRATDAFIGVAEADLEQARQLGIVRARHEVALIRSGMDLEKYRQPKRSKDEMRRELGLSPDEPVILAITNFKPQKDPLTLIRAFAELYRQHMRARLVIAGDGPLRAEVQTEIRKWGLSDRILLLGWRNDTAELLAMSDIVALSSRFEGLPRTAVQAALAQRSFVGTRVNGTPEVIIDGENGFLVEPGDYRGMGLAMARALRERPTFTRVDLEEWDLRRMVQKHALLYERLLQRKLRS